jgi:hypothetical protein
MSTVAMPTIETMPIMEGSNSLSTNDWLAKQVHLCLTTDFAPIAGTTAEQLEPISERAFGSHLSEAATTLKKLFSR